MNKRFADLAEDPKEFSRTWSNLRPSLEVLEKLLDELIKEAEVVTKNDFDCPNHYAKLAYQAGQVKAYEFVKSLLK